MSVVLDGDVIRLTGECLVEDAEALTALLDRGGPASVDLAECRQLHGAVLQTLLFYGPSVTGEPADAFLSQWIFPILARRTSIPQDKDPAQI